MAKEKFNHDREFNAAHQRTSGTRRALRVVDTAIGELEFFQEQFHRCQPPPMEEICQVFQAVRWKNKTSIFCRSGKIVLALLYDSPQEIKQYFEDPLLTVKVRSYNNIFASVSIGVSFA